MNCPNITLLLNPLLAFCIFINHAHHSLLVQMKVNTWNFVNKHEKEKKTSVAQNSSMKMQASLLFYRQLCWKKKKAIFRSTGRFHITVGKVMWRSKQEAILLPVVVIKLSLSIKPVTVHSQCLLSAYTQDATIYMQA